MSGISSGTIFRRAGTIAVATLMVCATVIQTTSLVEFRELRGNIVEVVSGTYAFWLVLLIIVWLAATVLIFFHEHGKPAFRSGTILSENGILLFDREQHIAFSVQTLKSLLLRLSQEAPEGRAEELLFLSGLSAGKRFGSHFSEIYKEQFEQENYKPWESLNDNGKLDAWEAYDTTGGWGKISAYKSVSNKSVEVTFRHPTLFDGEGGAIFSWLLAGYCQEVIAEIIERDAKFDRQKGILTDDGRLQLFYKYT